MIKADHSVAARHQDAFPESPTQHIERLPECRPGVLLVEIRPEEGEECVSRVERPRRGYCQVRQEREPLGLRQHGVELTVIRTANVNRSQYRQPDHRTRLRIPVFFLCESSVTLASRPGDAGRLF